MPRPLPASTSRPFALGPANAPTRVLLCHGYSGSPYEVLPLAEVLAQAGARCVGPLLPGHGTQPKDMARLTADQLLAHVRDQTHALLAEGASGGQVVLVGLSTGGLLAACVAAELGARASSLIMLAPALRLFPSGQAAIMGARMGLARLMPFVTKDHPGGDCGDAEGQALNTGYPCVTLGGLPALGDLQKRTRLALPQVTCPSLVVQGEQDNTVPPKVAAQVEGLLTAARVCKRLMLPASHHLIPLDTERDALSDAVMAFLRQHAGFDGA